MTKNVFVKTISLFGDTYTGPQENYLLESTFFIVFMGIFHLIHYTKNEVSH